MIFAKTFKIFLHLIQGKVSLEIMFEDVLHNKETFLDYKNNTFQKMPKIPVFQRG